MLQSVATSPLHNHDTDAREAVFDGVLFRSTGEARWAVFLKHLGVDYEYEESTFQVAPSTLYTPGFFLPRLDVWLDVKPAYSPRREIERYKADMFAGQTNARVWLSNGSPRAGSWYVEQLGGRHRAVSRAMIGVDRDAPHSGLSLVGVNDNSPRLLVETCAPADWRPRLSSVDELLGNSVIRIATSNAEHFDPRDNSGWQTIGMHVKRLSDNARARGRSAWTGQDLAQTFGPR